MAQTSVAVDRMITPLAGSDNSPSRTHARRYPTLSAERVWFQITSVVYGYRNQLFGCARLTFRRPWPILGACSLRRDNQDE